MTFRLGAAALLLAGLAAPALAGPAGVNPGSGSLAFGTPDQAAGRELIARCRQVGIPGEYYYEFQLQLRPRRGPERIYRGRLWGARNVDGPIWRIEIDLGGGSVGRWLVQSGPRSSVWESRDGAAPRSVGALEPMVPGTDLTPFDIEFPPAYLYWPNETLVGLTRVLGRPAYVFIFRPPAGFAARHAAIAGIRASLDTEFDVPIETEVLGPNDEPAKTLSLIDLKRVRGQWVVKEVDARDDATGDITRFDLTGAAAGLSFLPDLFDRSSLPRRIAPPPDAQVDRFGP